MASFSNLVNGSPYGHISPSRGVRHGDPLSPSIFILCSEVLSRLMLRAEQMGHIRGIKMGREVLVLSYLLFADDLLLFGKATRREAEALEGCL